MVCVAEGGDTKAIYDELISIGVKRFQGFYIAHPLSSVNVMKLIAE